MDCIDLTLDSNDESFKTLSKLSKPIVDEDSDIEFVEPSPRDLVCSHKKRAINDRIRTRSSTRATGNLCQNEQHKPNDLNLPSASSSTRNLARNATAGPSEHSAVISEDERLARELQEKERKEYRDLIEGVVNRKEGIVFRTIVNADGTLEDGSPAHPDDLERFEPWKKLFESTSGGAKVKRYHWIVNYELEKRFEEAKASLRGVEGVDDLSKELLLFHGTLLKNIDSILETGFRIGGIGGHAVVNGTCEGYGMYTTTQANISFGHALGADRIFACRVCPSQITSNLAYSTNPPSTTNPVDEKYQSYSANGTIYVVRYSSLVLPCYMIEFEQRQYSNLWWGMGAGGVLGGGGPGAGLVALGGIGAGAGGMGAFAALPPLPPLVPLIAPSRAIGKGKARGKGKAKEEVLGASIGARPMTRSRMAAGEEVLGESMGKIPKTRSRMATDKGVKEEGSP
ncbi:hypothetical protein BT96DRAFT_921484 [Gymnopus androsaceus JB14]|uniref:PARP catalytic domain-containing protein n=1 Tax=Gymnopus androsaceus JB14 TaxID=1447944 RepID=A0A6A4HHV7_9AGAR|nr:hypothetical protein BT96DRAFT_921484 [Gymnopus androsaceus JB14]